MLRRNRPSEAGQSVIELALLMPLLLVMVMGIVDVGRMFYLTMALTGAARAGAQYGSRGQVYASNTAGIQAAAAAEAVSIGSASGGSWWGTATNFATTAARTCQCENGTAVSPCTTVNACSGGKVFTLLEVNTSANYSPLAGFLGLSATTLHGRAVTKVLND